VVATPNQTAVLDALARDVDAGFESLVRMHLGAVYSTALRLSGSRHNAEDLTQDAFVRAYRALRRFDADRIRALQPRPWLITITLNVWRNHLRSAARRPRTDGHPPPDVADHGRGPAGRAEDNADARALARLLAELPERHRVPVVLRHVVGMSYAEIAAAQSCPVGTAKANVARGVAALKELARAPAPPPARPAAGRSTSPRRARRRVVSPVPEEVS
jgi:RNA polymerase sigma factor (sigma-70 family)